MKLKRSHYRLSTLLILVLLATLVLGACGQKEEEVLSMYVAYGGPDIIAQAFEAETGIKAGPHDLRRTWANLADKVGLGAYAIKAALNHLTTGDVTGLHYAQVDVEDLRPLMQRVEDFILRAAEQRTDNVVELRAGSAQ